MTLIVKLVQAPSEGQPHGLATGIDGKVDVAVAVTSIAATTAILRTDQNAEPQLSTELKGTQGLIPKGPEGAPLRIHCHNPNLVRRLNLEQDLSMGCIHLENVLGCSHPQSINKIEIGCECATRFGRLLLGTKR